MIIDLIPKKCRLETDALSWIVAYYQGETEDGEEKWVRKIHCSDIESILKSFNDREVRSIESSDFGKILKEIRKTRKIIEKVLGNAEKRPKKFIFSKRK